MGNCTKNMSLTRLLLLAGIVVLASSFPADQIIPEGNHAEVLLHPANPVTMHKQPTNANSDMTTKSTDFDHRAKALDTIALVKAQGGGTEECEAVATELKKAVNGAVTTSNKELAVLSTGSECPERGQADVKACGIKLQAAEEDASAAGDAVQAALDAPQTLGLEALMKCMSTDVCPQIDAAKATLNTANKAQVQKDAAVAATQEECSDFVKSAAQQMTECQCTVKKAHTKAWGDATSGAAERDKSWKTAEQLLCALNKDATCETSPTPTVEAIKFAAGVADAICATPQSEFSEVCYIRTGWRGSIYHAASADDEKAECSEIAVDGQAKDFDGTTKSCMSFVEDGKGSTPSYKTAWMCPTCFSSCDKYCDFMGDKRPDCKRGCTATAHPGVGSNAVLYGYQCQKNFEAAKCLQWSGSSHPETGKHTFNDLGYCKQWEAPAGLSS